MLIMPSRSLRECAKPGCHQLVVSGRCAAHSTKRVIRDPAVKAMYNSPRWQAMRLVHLAQHPWCVDCLAKGEHVVATEVDHVKPHNGDPRLFFDPSNLQSLCKRSHSAKTAGEVWHE